MNFIDYIKGNRAGENAHKIEKESMRDPFMYEAIEGFDSIQDNHLERLDGIKKRLNLRTTIPNKTKTFRHMWQVSAAAAAAVVIFALAGYLYQADYNNNLYSENIETYEGEDIIKIYVPEEYYTENITVIARYNANTIKSHNLDRGYKAKTKTTQSEQKNQTEKVEIIDIYIPE